jgi:hypothetical protein
MSVSSFCFTHRKKIFSLLHAVHVFSLFVYSIYVMLCLACPFLTFSCITLSASSQELYPYQPIPNASVCTCLDSIPVALFARPKFAYRSLCSKRHANFLFSLLLILAGDVSLNPGPTTSTHINAYCTNIRSASSITEQLDKPELIQKYILDKQADIFLLTETWLSPDSPSSVLNQLTPPGYAIQHVARPSGRGGGIAAIFRSSFSVSIIKTHVFSSFEHLFLRLTCSCKTYLFLTLYRPPSLSKSDFMSDFAVLLEDLASSPSALIVMGDFNLYLDQPDDHYTSAFSSLLDTFDFKQHITTPTHSAGHILDLLITQSTTPISEFGTTELFLSDHSTVFCQLPVPLYTRPSRLIKTIRKYSAICPETFSSDILSSVLHSDPSETLSVFTDQFHTVLSTLIDKHAPSKTISCPSSPNKPFYSADLKTEKSKRSKLETIFRKPNSTNKDKQKYLNQCKL